MKGFMLIKSSPYIVGLLLACAAVLTGCGHANIEKGDTSLRLGDYPAAIKFFSAELQRRPDCYPARLGLAKAVFQKSVDEHIDLTLWKEGLMHLEAARTVAPAEEEENVTALLSEAWVYHARALLAAADTVGALADLSRAIEYNPRSVEPLNLAGILYFQLGDAQKSIALFERAAAIDSTSPSAHFNLGMVHWQQGDIRSAHGHWLTALKLAPADEDILYWFALAEKNIREME